VIGGYIPGAHGVDAIVVGYYRGQDLIYVTPRTWRAVDGRLTLYTALPSWREPPNHGPKDCCMRIPPKRKAQFGLLPHRQIL